MNSDKKMKGLDLSSFILSTDKSKIDMDAVYAYLAQESYWAKGMTQNTFQKSLENSLCFGVYLGKTQVGFARVISDFATFAYICDLFILADHRKKGLSKFLMQGILSHPQLQGLRRLLLATWDAHGLYSQAGFTSLARPEIWMEIKEK